MSLNSIITLKHCHRGRKRWYTSAANNNSSAHVHIIYNFLLWREEETADGLFFVGYHWCLLWFYCDNSLLSLKRSFRSKMNNVHQWGSSQRRTRNTTGYITKLVCYKFENCYCRYLPVCGSIIICCVILLILTDARFTKDGG